MSVCLVPRNVEKQNTRSLALQWLQDRQIKPYQWWKWITWQMDVKLKGDDFIQNVGPKTLCRHLRSDRVWKWATFGQRNDSDDNVMGGGEGKTECDKPRRSQRRNQTQKQSEYRKFHSRWGRNLSNLEMLIKYKVMQKQGRQGPWLARTLCPTCCFLHPKTNYAWCVPFRPTLYRNKCRLPNLCYI